MMRSRCASSLKRTGSGSSMPRALDVDAFVAVDQDVADGRVLEQRLERAEAGHLVEDFRDELVELLRVEREPLDQHVLRDELLDVRRGSRPPAASPAPTD